MNGLPVAGVLPVALPRHRVERLSVLFDVHHDRLYRLARRLAPSSDDALDLVQETFLKTARSSTEVPFGLSSEEAWLVRVLINVCRDQQRKMALRKRHENEMGRSVTVEYDHEAALIARASVWRALDTLTTRRRAVVVMHELEGLGVPAIASLLGISAVTVRWHLSRGRRDLARAFRPHMGETNENR